MIIGPIKKNVAKFEIIKLKDTRLKKYIIIGNIITCADIDKLKISIIFFKIKFLILNLKIRIL